MQDYTITLISTLLAEKAIAAQIAARDAKIRYSQNPDCPEESRRCVDAMMECINILAAENDFFAHIGREVSHGNHR